MAEAANGANVLENTLHIPIADLTSSLLDTATKSIKAVITLTWPYSSVTGAVAFLLSEPDFRLRRSRGQVRVQFSGPSAKAVKESGIASGDEVILSLDGVEWIQNEATVTTPGRGVEFELKFAERLLLQFKQEDTEEVKKIDINHPELEVESPLPPTAPVVEIETASFAPTPQKRPRPDATSKTSGEYSSPAFIKRARTSYGSLFDSDYDPFEEEDGTRPGKGRKRTRLSTTWRYSSRSPTPEIDDAMAELPTSRPDKELHEAPSMMDEACQTIDLEEGNAAETLANFNRQAINVGGISYPKINGTALREEPGNETRPDSHHQLDNQEVHQELPEAPISPTLRPLHSDLLPIVSPLVTTKFQYSRNESEEIKGEAQRDQQHPHFDEQVSVPMETRSPAAEDDIYNASPPGRRISSTSYAPVNNNERIPEHDVLYDHILQGQGDSVMDELNNSNASSPKESEALGGQENYVSDSIVPSVSLDPSGVSQYPDPDDGFQSHTTSTWGSHPSVVYPPLPAFSGRYDEQEEIHLAPPLPQAAAMSRSQSARSTAIDLTESSDEEEVQGECFVDENEYENIEMEEAPRFSATGAHRNPQQHTEAFGDDQEEYEEEESYSDRNQQYLNRGKDEEEQYSRYDEEGSVEGEEEEYSDEEVEEPYHPVARDPRLSEDYDDEEDEEGESYDEDEIEEHVPPTQHEKIVIDLLSSDEDEEDEEDEEDVPPLTKKRPIIPSEDSVVQRPVHTQLAEEEEKSERSEEDEEVDAGEDIEVEEDTPNLARQPQRRIDSDKQEPQSEDEDEDAVYEDDDQMEIVEDEEKFTVEVEKQEKPERSTSDQDRVAPIEKDLVEEEMIESHKSEPHESNQHNHDGDIIEKETDTEQSDANALTDRLLDQLAKPPPEGPSLFSRVFNLDGANDERFDVLYPKLPRNNSSTPPPASDEKAELQSQAAESSEQKQGQLPTPDATQLSQKLVYAEVSFSEPNIVPSDDTSHSGVEREEPEALEEDSANAIEVIEVITDLPESLQPTSAPASPTSVSEQMTANEQQDLEIATSQDIRFEADNTVPATEESAVDNDKTLVESEAIEITEDTAKVSIEEPTGEEIEENEFVNKLTDELIAQHIIVEGAITRSKAKQQNEHMEFTPKEPEYTAEAPRRSHRRAKSTTSTVHTEEDAHSTISVRPEGVKDPVVLEKDHSSPMVVINSSQETPKGHDASIELALSSLESPSKPHRELRTSPVVDLKLKLSRALRTELSEFTSLKVLRYHINQKLDVLAVATTSPPEPQRAKNGPRHYQITFNITDPSIAPSGVSEVQIFRPYKEALPKIHVGDGILLRNFQVISVKGRGGFALRSSLDEGSSWAVFRDGEEDQIRGPPVEYGVAEKNHIVTLKAWYSSLDPVARAKITRANGDKQK